jgi:5'-3' exonuclease
MVTQISINAKKPLVLIDTSYYIFNRYFATTKWFSFQEKEFNEEEFNDAFLKHVDADFKKIQKKLKTDINNIILCLDCPRSEIWRNELYSLYKATRTTKDNFDSNIFNTFNDYIKKIKIVQISYNKLEADDIVYLLHSQITKLNSKQSMIIITNDNDYLQLSNNHTKIINMQFKDITLRGTLNPQIDLLVKIIYGDKGDNINKILVGMTKEKAIKIALMSDEERNKFLIENDVMANYELNKKLISFESIPKDLVNNFYHNYNIYIL